MSDTIGVKIPSARKMTQITEVFTNDEDFRFSTVKANRDKPKFELPAPTEDEPDHIEVVGSFDAVILKVEKNFYQSQEDKDAGKEAKERRVLYILRNNKFQPEVIYLSPTSLRPWKEFVAGLIKSGNQYFGVLTRFTLERVVSKASGFNWNKFKFEVVQTLTPEELEHIAVIKPLTESRIRVYESDENLDKYEEEALNEGKPVTHKSDPEEAHSKAVSKSLDEDDEEVTPPPAKAKAKTEAKTEVKAEEPKKAAAKPGYSALEVDDDDEEVAKAARPKASRAASIEDDDD